MLTQKTFAYVIFTNEPVQLRSIGITWGKKKILIFFFFLIFSETLFLMFHFVIDYNISWNIIYILNVKGFLIFVSMYNSFNAQTFLNETCTLSCLQNITETAVFCEACEKMLRMLRFFFDVLVIFPHAR